MVLSSGMSVSVWSLAVFVSASIAAGWMGVDSSIGTGARVAISSSVSFKKSVILCGGCCNIRWSSGHRKGQHVSGRRQLRYVQIETGHIQKLFIRGFPVDTYSRAVEQFLGVFPGGGEGLENEHCAIGECELNVSPIAGCCGVGWHRHGKLETFHVHSHDRFGVEADQCVAAEVWCGLGGQGLPQASG
uniref:Secreted protein n=1 Tax=Romanomermis culicivorax TaxID=13658 RepID=A0A915JWT2_ROMCU